LLVHFGDVQALDERVRSQCLGTDAAAPAGADDCHADRIAHCVTLMLASLISFPYFAISALMNFENSCGVLDTATTPRSANFFFTSGSSSALTVSAWSFATIGRGTWAGKSTP